MYGCLLLLFFYRNHWVIVVEQFRKKGFSSGTLKNLLPCHWRLVFRLFFATSTTLWTYLLQKLSF